MRDRCPSLCSASHARAPSLSADIELIYHSSENRCLTLFAPDLEIVSSRHRSRQTGYETIGQLYRMRPPVLSKTLFCRGGVPRLD